MEQKRIFLEEAGETMVRCGYLSEGELAELEAEAGEPTESAGPRWSRHDRARSYARTTRHLKRMVRTLVPAGEIVLVVSKGDEALLELDGPIGWHFPQVADGTYAGSYPGSDEEVLRQLVELQARGAGYLAFPQPAFWWLEHYGELGQYLQTGGRLLHQDDQLILYRLEERG
jgi:hypothetical protein